MYGSWQAKSATQPLGSSHEGAASRSDGRRPACAPVLTPERETTLARYRGQHRYVFPVNRLSEARAEAAVRQSVNRQSLQEIAVRRYTWRVLRVRREVVIGAHGQLGVPSHPSPAGGVGLGVPERFMTPGLSAGSSETRQTVQVPKGRKRTDRFCHAFDMNFWLRSWPARPKGAGKNE